jgi:glycosyltransferase involved in cell wall biosynthesis
MLSKNHACTIQKELPAWLNINAKSIFQTQSFCNNTFDSRLKYMNVGVIIPALNEGKNIRDVLYKLDSLGFNNVLVIDGKSNDDTIEVASKHGATVVLQHGKGKGDAIRQVLNNNFFNVDALVLMDADGSMNPEEIPSFIEALKSGADVVKGSRFLKGGYTYDMTPMRRFGNKILTEIVNFLWPGARFTDSCYGFVVLNKRAIQCVAPTLKAQGFEVEIETLTRALEMGLTVKEVPSIEYKRKNGTSNLNAFKDGLKIFKTIIQQFFNEP